MKFNRTLSFDGSRELASTVSNGMDTSNTRASLSKLESERQSTARNLNLSAWKTQPLDPQLAMTQEFSPSFVGLAGVFIPIKNDFTPAAALQADDDYDEAIEQMNIGPRYSDAPHWPRHKCDKVKRVRFVICTLALFAIVFNLMSRLMLNVAIVEMVKKQPQHLSPDDSRIALEHATLPPSAHDNDDELKVFVDDNENLSSLIRNDDPLMFAATYDPHEQQDTTTDTATATTTTTVEPSTTIIQSEHSIESITEETDQTNGPLTPVDEDDGVQRFNWSKQDVNLIIGSFFFGYMPSILFSGDLAQRYGAKYPLFICIFGSALINILTPTIAGISLNLLIGSRIVLGLIQGSMMPALYELFNRWLTQTESSIFAPLMKVSMPLGSLIGTLMPGVLARYKLAWPLLFYIGGVLCLLWSLVWLFVATSLPQTNRFVEQSELNRIMRKKSAALKIIELPPPSQQPTVVVAEPNGDKGRRSLSKAVPQMDFKQQSDAATRRNTPWLKIVTNPSVLALTFTKFTYNIGIDFIMLQLAVYLREVHKAPMETISTIASGGFLMQMLLVAFVGWLAKTLVLKRAFGLSVTKWRKIFQGGANLTMASCYLLLAYTKPEIELASVLIIAICFFWMLGAGGESMIPYDLSTRFTAPIVGFSHSVSVMSAIVLTAIVGVVLGENTQDAGRWGLMFAILGSLLAAGGLTLIVVLKAKPFLEAEKQKARQQEAAAAAAAAVAVAKQNTVNKISR